MDSLRYVKPGGDERVRPFFPNRSERNVCTFRGTREKNIKNAQAFSVRQKGTAVEIGPRCYTYVCVCGSLSVYRAQHTAAAILTDRKLYCPVAGAIMQRMPEE